MALETLFDIGANAAAIIHESSRRRDCEKKQNVAVKMIDDENADDVDDDGTLWASSQIEMSRVGLDKQLQYLIT